jgi:hypothetical protein
MAMHDEFYYNDTITAGAAEAAVQTLASATGGAVRDQAVAAVELTAAANHQQQQQQQLALAVVAEVGAAVAPGTATPSAAATTTALTAAVVLRQQQYAETADRPQGCTCSLTSQRCATTTTLQLRCQRYDCYSR